MSLYRKNIYFLIILLVITTSLFFISPNIKADAKNSNFLDLQLDYSYQYWKPTFINNAEYETVGLNFAKLKIDFLEDSMLGQFLPQIQYEWTPNKPIDQQILIKKNNQADAKWERKKLDFNLPVLAENNDLYLGYDEQIYISKITTKVARYYDKEKINRGDLISALTEFKVISLGVAKEIGPYFFNNSSYGVVYTKYRKPYNITINEEQINTKIYNTDFSAGGIFVNLNDKFSLLNDSLLGEINLSLIGPAYGQMKFESWLIEEPTACVYVEPQLGVNFEKSFYKDNVKLQLDSNYKYKVFYTGRNKTVGNIKLNNDQIFNIYFGAAVEF